MHKIWCHKEIFDVAQRWLAPRLKAVNVMQVTQNLLGQDEQLQMARSVRRESSPFSP